MTGAKSSSGGSPTLLHIDTSPMGGASVSRELSERFATRWRERNPGGEVIARDLAATSLAPVTGDWVNASYAAPEARTSKQSDLLAQSDGFIAELRQADTYVIGLAFHNFSIPSVLKLWLDLLYRNGETFAYVDGKPTGLLRDKRLVVIMASGGDYTEGSRLAPLNHATPYLKTMFAIFGVTDLTVVFAGGTKVLRSGEIEREEFMRPHRRAIDDVVAGLSPVQSGIEKFWAVAGGDVAFLDRIVAIHQAAGLPA